MIRSTAPATHKNIATSQIKNDDGFTKGDFRPVQNVVQIHQNCAGHENYLWNHISISPISAHTCQCVSNAQKMSLMPHGWRSVRCPAPFTQNNLKMSQMSHAFEEKWTYRSKKRAPRAGKSRPSETRKTGQAFGASLRSRNAHGHLTSRELLYKPAQTQSKGPQPDPWSNPGPLPLRILTVRTPQCRHADGEKQNRLFKGHVCKRAKLDGEQETSHYLILF